ncbi:hypothetical protein [Paenibacillus pini]|uniref:hypothetical protein n=1 Tax=Paenibacillus pini TaxID=669461 RepID=UPI000A4F78FA|nr:hypothetical protein [Paenibacillus pini]
MEGWQKTAVIIALLTFIRLIIKDTLEYIDKRQRTKKSIRKGAKASRKGSNAKPKH